ncbi:mannitol dehydrogenase family protein [Roseomonas sp. BN140053]|uniref:mannitol dehydrogenase family protein n=1 Tax=Roseomonas sp. BN140053 TaxID=3391898 RepID=UPI0039E738D5
MIPLNARSLGDLPAAVAAPRYDRVAVTAGIAHLSFGNFHRAHQAVFLDRVLHLPGQAGWGICGIGVVDDAAERRKAAALAEQDGLYTLTECPPAGSPSRRVIGSVVDYVFAPDDPRAALRRLADPAIRVVSMTITEGGYASEAATGSRGALEMPHPDRPRGAFGFLVEALARRRQAGIAPFTVLSCDNLRSNGQAARAAVLRLARARDPELAAWIAAEVGFPNSMVDRVTPAVPPDRAAELNRQSGVVDALPVFCEDFLQWVLEDDFRAGRPPLDAVGVEFTADVSAHEVMKLRLLNAAHSMLAYPGRLAGLATVDAAVGEPRIRALLDAFLERDVLPTLALPPGLDPRRYGQQVLRRFSNPAIGDQLSRIAFDGLSKLPLFLGDTLRAGLEGGRDIRRLAFLLACFARHLGGVDDRGGRFVPEEPRLTEADRALLRDPDPAAPLRLSAFADWRLDRFPRFEAEFLRFRRGIAAAGTLATLAALLEEAEGAAAP